MSIERITYDNFQNDPFINELDINDETKGAYEILKWAYQTYENDIVYSCSFGAESMVLIDLISQIKPDAQIVFLDTDLHFQETYDLIDRVKDKYPQLRIKMKKPELRNKVRNIILLYGRMILTNVATYARLNH